MNSVQYYTNLLIYDQVLIVVFHVTEGLFDSALLSLV